MNLLKIHKKTGYNWDLTLMEIRERLPSNKGDLIILHQLTIELLGFMCTDRGDELKEVTDRFGFMVSTGEEAIVGEDDKPTIKLEKDSSLCSSDLMVEADADFAGLIFSSQKNIITPSGDLIDITFFMSQE